MDEEKIEGFKIVQIMSMGNSPWIMALCENGTLWEKTWVEKDGFTEKPWRAIATVIDELKNAND